MSPLPPPLLPLHRLHGLSTGRLQRASSRCNATADADGDNDASAAAGGVRARRVVRQQRRQLRRAAEPAEEEDEERAESSPSTTPAAAATAAEQADSSAEDDQQPASAARVRSSKADRRRRRAAPRLPRALTGDAPDPSAAAQRRQPKGARSGLGNDETDGDEELALVGGDDEAEQQHQEQQQEDVDDVDGEEEAEQEEEEEDEMVDEDFDAQLVTDSLLAAGVLRAVQPDPDGDPAAPAAPGERKPRPPPRQQFDPMVLSERSPMYVPVLTDEDLAADPPGHKSGYVAVIGKPNAGKSTLINALVGQKLSIVTFKPQTTRHRVVGIASDTDYQMILFDTPGVIEKKRTKLEERMMAAVVSSVKEAEAIVAVVDAADNPRDALGMFQPGDGWTGPPMAVLLNKADLLPPEEVEALAAWYKENCRAEAVFVGSAKDKRGIDELKAWAVSRLPEGPTLYPKDIISEQPERFFVAECVREQIFLHCEQEVPYCTQVVVTEFVERRGRKDFVAAEVVVEKESQKGILIGREGAMLKRIGAEARREIEAFLGRGIYLELSVQVSKDWRDSKEALSKYGYFDPMLI